MQLRNRDFFHFDGAGKFMRDGIYVTAAPRDDVFGAVPDGTTHVAWISRWVGTHPTSLPAPARFMS